MCSFGGTGKELGSYFMCMTDGGSGGGSGEKEDFFPMCSVLWRGRVDSLDLQIPFLFLFSPLHIPADPRAPCVVIQCSEASPAVHQWWLCEWGCP